MKVYRSLEEFEPVKNAVVTQGTFDGVHLGHQKIIRRLKKLAELSDGETVLITYFPHPRLVLFPDDNNLKLLNTIEEKIELLRKHGIDHLLILPFTKEFSRLSAFQFVRDILLNKIGTKVFVIGYDHRFGKNREGTFEDIKEFSQVFNFEVEEISAEDIDDLTISSTKIRNALLEGDVITAAKFLGDFYFLEGEVVKGNHLGRTIGFPTANIKVKESYKLIPGKGVYSVNIILDGQRHKGMLNIGVRPTVDGQAQTIETYIFDFDRDIYGEKVRVEFVDKIREEIKFNSLEELKIQLEKDRFVARTINK